MSIRLRLAAAISLLVTLAAVAQPSSGPKPGPAMVIYRCVAPDGSVTVQNATRCPKGAMSQRRVIDTPRRVSAPPAPAVLPAVVPVKAIVQAAPAPAPATVAALRSAPELYACATRDDAKYFGDVAEPTRCAPMTAVSLDRSSPVDAAACESVRDTCTPVPEAERCAAWDERRRVAESASQFQPQQFDAAREELERVRVATEGTVCAR